MKRREFIALLPVRLLGQSGRMGSNQSGCGWSEFSWGAPITQKRGRG